MIGVLALGSLLVLASILANWLTSGFGDRTCRCHVEPFGAAPPSIDSEVLALLRAQLDRCGPDALHCPAVVQCPVAATAAPRFTDELVALSVIVAFIGGFVLGHLLRVPAVIGAPHRCAALPAAVVTSSARAGRIEAEPPVPAAPPVTTAAPASPTGAPGLTPSSLRALKDGPGRADADA
jgi:hypothetical protein